MQGGDGLFYQRTFSKRSNMNMQCKHIVTEEDEIGFSQTNKYRRRR